MVGNQGEGNFESCQGILIRPRKTWTGGMLTGKPQETLISCQARFKLGHVAFANLLGMRRFPFPLLRVWVSRGRG
jgi:hypothetical protein